MKRKKQVILEGYKKGLTRQEIVEKYPEQELTNSDVKNIRNMLINEQVITEEDIEQYRKLRREIEKDSNKPITPKQRQTLTYLRMGYFPKEISNLINEPINNIYSRIRTLEEKGRITKNEIEQYREERKAKEEQQEKYELWNN